MKPLTEKEILEKQEEAFLGLKGNAHAEELLRLLVNGAELSMETVALLAIAQEVRNNNGR